MSDSCDYMYGSKTGFPVFHCVAEFPHTHVHWVSDAVSPSHPFDTSLLTIFPSIVVSSNELDLHIMWPKRCSFIFSIGLSIEYCSTTSKTNLMFPITKQYWALIKFNSTAILSSRKSQHCCLAILLPFSPPVIELLPYSFSCLKRPANPSLSANQEFFLPPSPKMSAWSLIILCSEGLLYTANSFLYHEVQHTRLPCSSPTSRVCSNSCSSSQWCHPTISSSVFPFASCI